MSAPTVTLRPEPLVAALVRLFEACGSSRAEAEMVAGHLVESDLQGHPSHGIGLVPRYVDAVDAGTVVPNRRVTRVETTGDFLVFDAGHGYGQAVGLEMCERVAAAVAERGSVVFALRNAHHLGRLGAYGEALARRGIASVTFTNVSSRAMVAPYGGRTAVLGTNPIAIAIPRQGEPPIVLDFATSTVAVGKVRVAYETGRPVAEGILLDADGRPTTDPSVMYPPPGQPTGAVTAMAEHKGGGLNLVCELFAAMIGGATMVDVENERIVNSTVGMAFATEALPGAGAALEAAVANVLAAPTREGATIRLPGTIERERKAVLAETGIPLARATWQAIVDRAVRRGLDAAIFHAAEAGTPG